MECERCVRLVRAYLLKHCGVWRQFDLEDVQQSTCVACLERRYRDRVRSIAWSTLICGAARSACSGWRRQLAREAESEYEREQRLAAQRPAGRAWYYANRERVLAALRERRAGEKLAKGGTRVQGGGEIAERGATSGVEFQPATEKRA